MSCLLLSLLCDFAALTVSAQTCGEHVLEGTSCSINWKRTNNEKAADIRWGFTSSDGNTTEWKKGSSRKLPAGLTIEEDGSLRFESARQNNTGTYKYTAFDASGQMIGTETMEIKVYVKVPKPNVKSECKPDGTVALLCDIGNYKDLTISWCEDDKVMKDETETHLTLALSKIMENKQYACSVSNPVSSEQSDRITVSCCSSGLCIDFWVMMRILAGGGALLFLLLSVVICCACRSCRQYKKNQPSFETHFVYSNDEETNYETINIKHKKTTTCNIS